MLEGDGDLISQSPHPFVLELAVFDDVMFSLHVFRR